MEGNIEKNIVVILCRLGDKPKIEIIPNDLKWMQEFVGRYIETAPLSSDGLIVVCNDNEIRLNLPVTCNFGLGILGNFFICRIDGMELASITENDKEMLNLI